MTGICGARTSRGGYCRNLAGSCPHHGMGGITWDSTPRGPEEAEYRPSQGPSRLARELVGVGRLGLSPTWWMVFSAAAPLVWLLVAWLPSPKSMIGDPYVGAISLLLGLVPAMFAVWYWTLCGAWNTTGPRRRCRNRRRGLFVRCHHHRGVTMWDVYGLLWAAVFAVLIPGRVALLRALLG